MQRAAHAFPAPRILLPARCTQRIAIRRQLAQDGGATGIHLASRLARLHTRQLGARVAGQVALAGVAAAECGAFAIIRIRRDNRFGPRSLAGTGM